MALKALVLRKKINGAKKALQDHLAKADDLQKREAELEKAIEEAQTDEEQSAVDEAVEEFDKEKAEFEETKGALEGEVNRLEDELRAEEEAQEQTAPEPEAAAPAEAQTEERSAYRNMSKRNLFAHMSAQERTALFASEGVQNWLGEIRSAIREKRAIQGVGLTIAEEFLGLLKENIEGYSKLYKYVSVKKISGDGRQVIMGSIPEAIWTDCCANLNELSLNFSDEEYGCWKLGGFYGVCNANLEDSDIDLASEILSAIGQAIGLGLDKAILYGTGDHMPLGIVTRLVQTSKPAGYSSTARPWVDLHTSNVKAINSSGMTAAQLFSAIVTDFGAAKNKYGSGTVVWAMNNKTKTALMAATIATDQDGRIVTGVADTMPVIGGKIETLDFMPDNVFVGGYFDGYGLAERAGAKFATSEHVRFLADQTIMKGTARYDGKPVIAEAFVAMSLLNTSIAATDVTFAPNEANTAAGIVLNKSAASVTVATGTQHTAKLVASTLPEDMPVTWTSADTSKATVSSTGVVTAVDTGTTTVTAASGVANAFCTVTVS